MSYTQTHILASESWGGFRADGNGLPLVQPSNGASFERANALQFGGRIVSVTGGTTYTVSIGFQVALPHTAGQQFQQVGWLDVTAEQLGVVVVGGEISEGRVLLASSTDPLPAGFTVTIPEWRGARLRSVIDIEYTGTMPTVKASLTLTEWGD